MTDNLFEDQPLEPELRDALRAANPRAEVDYDRLAIAILKAKPRVARPGRWADRIIPFAIAAGLAALAISYSRGTTNGVVIADNGPDRDSVIVDATLRGSSDPLLDRVARPTGDAPLIDALSR